MEATVKPSEKHCVLYAVSEMVELSWTHSIQYTIYTMLSVQCIFAYLCGVKINLAKL